MLMVPGIDAARKEAQRITPVEVIAYPDNVQVWSKTVFPTTQLEWLGARCGNGLDVELRPKRWDRSRQYQQRLQLRRPSREALQWLSASDGILVNYLELALDWSFDHVDERDEAHDFVCKYHVKRWHGDQKIKFVKGTRYTGERQTANKLVSYADLPSRMTGEVYCVHLEWRLNGVQALRRAGIETVSELLKLDAHEFWKKRLIMRAVDCRALGRQYQIHVLGKGRRRGPYFGSKKTAAYDFDIMVGGTLVMMRGSTQAVVDEFRKGFDVARCLREIDVPQLLPKAWDMGTNEMFRKEAGVNGYTEKSAENNVCGPAQRQREDQDGHEGDFVG